VRTATVQCPSCGSAAPAAVDYCRRCGNDLTSPGLLPILDDPAESTEVIDRVRSTPKPVPAAAARGRRWTPVAVVTAGAMLLAAGAYAGYRVVADGRARPPVQAASPTASAAPAQPTGVGGRPPAGNGQPTAQPTGGPDQPSGGPTGDGLTQPLVVAAPALAARPETAEIVALFTKHFGGINHRDYDAVRGTFTVEGWPGLTRKSFGQVYRSTQDSGVRVFAVVATGTGYEVSVSFTSHQDLADAPPDEQATCLEWSMTYPLARQGGVLLIDQRPTTNKTRC
jgi:hypothetical protein